MPELMNALSTVPESGVGMDLLKLASVILVIAVLRALERFLGDRPARRGGR